MPVIILLRKNKLKHIDMNKKLTLAIVTGSITFIVAALNTSLNMQSNSSVSLILNNIESFANNGSECDNCDLENDPIALHGSLIDRPVRSYSSTPFHAIKYSSHIAVYYLIDLNNISVKVVNASGQIVYSTNVNPVAGGQLYIGLTSLSSGDYTITFTGTNGNSVYGDFEI
jgi:hypothetical protein